MTEAAGEYANAPVPQHLTVAGWRVALIIASFSIALPGFLNGAQTGLALGFFPAVLAALLAGLLLALGGCLTSTISVRTRLTTYLLVQRSFGKQGAALVNTVIAIVHFCWFGVNVSFFGDAMVAASGQGYGIPGDFRSFVIVGSVLMTVSTIFGFRALGRLALVAVPLLGAILITVCVMALRQHGVVLHAAAHPPAPMSFGIAVSALVGGNMLTIATMPDLARYIRSTKQALLSMALSFPIAAPLLMIAAALPALAMGETDIMKLVVGFGLGAPALFMLVLSTWTINAGNLYSASLSLTATFPAMRQWFFILVGGAIGTIFALMGIINAFIPFLLFLGLIIPPIAAIYVIDGFVTFRHTDAGQSIRNLPSFRWHAIGTWLGSIAVTLVAYYEGLTVTTVPTLDATLLAAIVYATVLRVRARRSGSAFELGEAPYRDPALHPRPEDRMIDLDEIDPEIRQFLQDMRAEWAKYPPFDTLPVVEQRALAERVRARWTEGGPVMASTQEHRFDPGAGELRVRVHIPDNAPDPAPALVYLHGGGFTLFSIDTHDRLMREYAARGGFAVIGIDYPLSPEAKFPAALDRIEAFMLWLRDHAADWNIDPERIAMGGDSAGGNLSFATFMRLRDRGDQGIVKAILSNYGGFSSQLSDEAEARFGGPGSIMDRAEAQQYWVNYLPSERYQTDPYACPIHADLTGFPPVLLVIPELDIVAENSFAMEIRLRDAGVDVTSIVYRGAIHSFLEAMSISSVARTAIADGANFVRSHICQIPAP